MNQFTSNPQRPHVRLEPNDLFIGFNSDTTASLVLHLTHTEPERFDPKNVLTEAKKYLLRCATPDCVLRTTAKVNLSTTEKKAIWDEYFVAQSHLALDQLMAYHLNNDGGDLIQITTHSKSTLLSLELGDLKVKKKREKI